MVSEIRQTYIYNDMIQIKMRILKIKMNFTKLFPDVKHF